MTSDEVTYEATFVTNESLPAVKEWFEKNDKQYVKPDATWLGKVVVIYSQEGRKAKGWQRYDPDDFLRRFDWLELNETGFAPVEKAK